MCWREGKEGRREGGREGGRGKEGREREGGRREGGGREKERGKKISATVMEDFKSRKERGRGR